MQWGSTAETESLGQGSVENKEAIILFLCTHLVSMHGWIAPAVWNITVPGMLFCFFSLFGSVHFYWGSAKNKVFCCHTESRDD